MSGNNGNKLMQRISYACGTFGHDIFYMMVSTYFIMFITSNLFNTEDQSPKKKNHKPRKRRKKR